MQIRWLYAFPELLTCYMDLRGITWQGEKQAVKYLETANPGFLSDFFKCIQSTVMTEKMRLYKGLLIEATKPAGPVWNQTTAAVSTGEPFGLSDATDALRLWEKLTE